MGNIWENRNKKSFKSSVIKIIMTQDEIFISGFENQKVDSFVRNFVKKYIHKKYKVLDLGCGTGRHSIFLSKKGHDVYALDKSKIAIEKLKQENLENIKLFNQKFSQGLFKKDLFDVVLSIMVLHHAPVREIHKNFNAIKSILNKGGYFIFSVISVEDHRFNTGYEIEKDTKINIDNTFDFEIPHHFFTKKEIQILLKDYDILEMKQKSRISAKGFDKFVHWDVIARLK